MSHGLLWLPLVDDAPGGSVGSHGAQRAVAVTEANIGASICATLAPVCVGGLQRLGLGWRSAPLLAVMLFAGLALSLYTQTIPTMQQHVRLSRGTRQRLPMAFWAYLTVLCVGIAVEWCMVAWSGDFLQHVIGVRQADAASVVSLFFLAEVLGRVLGAIWRASMPARTCCWQRARSPSGVSASSGWRRQHLLPSSAYFSLA